MLGNCTQRLKLHRAKKVDIDEFPTLGKKKRVLRRRSIWFWVNPVGRGWPKAADPLRWFGDSTYM